MKKFVGTPYYIAPEIFKKKYNYKVDLWSLGVIMYTLISGIPPFFGQNDTEIFESIRNDELKFNKVFDDVSEEAKDFIRLFLQKDYKTRIELDSALNHPWFESKLRRNQTICFNSDTESDTNMRMVNPQHLKNLINFRYKSKIQEIIFKFYVNQITTKLEREVPYFYQQVFQKHLFNLLQRLKYLLCLRFVD